MKTFKNSLAVLVVSLGLILVETVNVYAGFGGSVVMSPISGSKKAIVTIGNVNERPLIIQVKDSKGILISKVKEKSCVNYSKVFNFTELSDGKYTLEIRIENDLLIKEFFIENDELIVKSDLTKKVQPFISYKNNQLDISHLNNDKNSVYFYLLNDIGEIVHKEYIGDNVVILKRIDLKKFEKGKYYIVLKTDEKEYQKEIVIQ